MQQVQTRKIGKLEITILVLTGMTLAFLAGYAMGTCGSAEPYRVAVEQNDSVPPRESPAESRAPGLLEGERININTAPAADLERLPGIGEKRAADIVAYREGHGPFRIPEDLTDVPGIGEQTLQGLLTYITVGEE